MTLTTLRLSSSGRHVACRDQGRGAPVVLIHGVGMQSAAWGPQIEALSKTHRVIAVDMPGHGGSAPLHRSARLPDFVAWFHELVMAMGGVPVSVAGHSMGALIACGFAVEHPHLCDRVALLNCVHRRDPEAKRAVIARAEAIAKGGIDRETPLSRWFGQSPADQDARGLVARWLADVDPVGYATAYAAFAHGDATYADRIPAIGCPLLALTGDGDPNSTPSMSRTIADLAQNGREVTVEGHRHMVNLTAPECVNRHLRAWLVQGRAQE